MLHDLRIKLGARPVHVAQYAKRWNRLYAYLRKSVMINAINYAAENGFKAVTCGHTHYAEEQIVKGIQYINTGAWTEKPTFYVHVNDNEIALKKAADSTGLKSHGADSVPAAPALHQNSAQPITHHN